MIAVVDYGAGNLRSVAKALAAVGAHVEIIESGLALAAAKKIVLPGVGAFRDGMAALQQRDLVPALREAVAAGTPLLGICLGMQVLFETGEEHGNHAGLGLLPGTVRAFPAGKLKIPHTGWNQIVPARPGALLDGLPPGSHAYFNHGYYCDPSMASDVLASTEYGMRFASVVGRGHVFGVQFHPEKSQTAGLKILKNFVELC